MFSEDPRAVKEGLITVQDFKAIAARYGYSEGANSKNIWINPKNEFDFVAAADVHRGIDRNYLIELNVDTRILG